MRACRDGLPLLTTGLPEAVEVHGVSLPVRTDFRAGLLAWSLLGDDTLPDAVAAEAFVAIFRLGEKPMDEDPAATLAAVWRFYTMAADGSFWEYRQSAAEDVVDFAADEDWLVASFRQAYGMDLFTAHLHWWEFLMLLTGLPADTPLMEAVRVRTMEPGRGMGEEGRYLLRQARRAVRLPARGNHKGETGGIE